MSSIKFVGAILMDRHRSFLVDLAAVEQLWVSNGRVRFGRVGHDPEHDQSIEVTDTELRQVQDAWISARLGKNQAGGAS